MKSIYKQIQSLRFYPGSRGEKDDISAVAKKEALIQADLLNMRGEPDWMEGMGNQATPHWERSRDLISTGSTLSNSFWSIARQVSDPPNLV